MKYKQLTYEERIQIDTLHRSGVSIRGIAAVLERSPNTISRELREKTIRGTYLPKKAHHKTYWRRYKSKRKCMKVATSPSLIQLVHEKLEAGWSPERIAGYSTRAGNSVSKKAIYKYIQSRCLERHLFWKKHKKRSGRKRGSCTHQDTQKRHMSSRPIIQTSGHWELDFIVSAKSKAVLLVLVDIHTRYALVKVLPRKTHQLVLGALADIADRHSIKTITTDNDIVFQKWPDMERYLKTVFYFCRPYHSWEKGLVENTNRWIRLFVPKRQDIATVTDDDLRSIHRYLNDIPRQCLNFRTAREVLLGDRVS